MIQGWDMYVTFADGLVTVLHAHGTIHALLARIEEVNTAIQAEGEELPVRVQIFPAE